MADALRREFIYLAYYFSVQLEQILPYWALGILIGSVVSVFGKAKIQRVFAAMGAKKLGVLGLIPAHERSSSVNLRGPSERSWTMSTVHFEPTISAAPATEHVGAA